MIFKERLKFYLVGVFFGLIIVYFSLVKNRDRDFGSWLPENRVLSKIDSLELIASPEVLNCLNCANINLIEIKESLSEANVNFKQSNLDNRNAPIYKIEGAIKKNQKYIITIECLERKSILNSIKINPKPKNCSCF